jgi:hypothetical protein
LVSWLATAGIGEAAQQSSYVIPGSGPKSMAALVAENFNPALRALASCHNGPSAPANGPSGAPLAYQCWVDTTSNPSLYKLYDGASWVTLGSLNTSSHVWIPYLTGGTSGGVPYFASAGVLASSAALAQNGVVIGGGAGAAPASIAAGTDDQVLFGRSSNSPLFRSVTGDVTFASGVAAIGASKVTNAQLAAMAANTTKCNATAGSANPTDCTASTMRTNLGLVLGTNVEAWDADLDCIAAISTTGVISRTGAGTCAVRTVTAPAAGITISNGDGVAGNIALALANDLAALEALNGLGIAKRTGVDSWSVGDAVANSELATMAAYTIKGNATGSSATPTDISIPALTQKSSPVSGDIVMIADSAASNALKYTTVGALASAGSVASLNGATGAVTTSVVARVFAASGTYTPTTGMTHAIIECMGGGGAGGGSTANTSFFTGGGGGGAGSYSRKVVSAADVGASKTVTIGAGGTGATNALGGSGGDTSVGTLCVGKGGTGGALGTSGAFGLGGAGGVVGTGDARLPGASGGNSAYQSGTNVGIVMPSGMGAVSQLGGGGVQASPVSGSFVNGVASAGFGGGGSGGASSYSSSNSAGGNGAPGVVIITEFITQ